MTTPKDIIAAGIRNYCQSIADEIVHTGIAAAHKSTLKYTHDSADEIADYILSGLKLREERRTNVMSSAGMTVNSRTGETTHHHDMRYDQRWVTDWQSEARP